MPPHPRSPARARLETVAYRAGHLALQVQGIAAQRLLRVAAGLPRDRDPAAEAAVRARFHALLDADLDHARRGDYPPSLLLDLPVAGYARRLPALALELPRAMARRRRGDYRDLPGDVDLSRYPPYYRRTFHWQTGGYLTRRSAELYDPSVEMLFLGAADVMRRQVLPPITRFVRASGVPAPRILDVACGTGRTLRMLARALPGARLWGLDLSPYYLEVAREVLAGIPEVSLVAENAEAMPLADGAFDVVTSTYLFHELPRPARRKVLAEIRRVLRPGGRLVIEDSAQRGDGEAIAFLLDRFAADLHEPFFREYVGDDLVALMAECGFEALAEVPAFVSKVVVGRRPG